MRRLERWVRVGGAPVIGILGAMTAEIQQIGELLDDPNTSEAGGREYLTGTVDDQQAVVAISGFGKVAAASTVTTMLDLFEPDSIVFTGVAGGLHSKVARGDVVVAEALVQHDFDASPIVPRFVIPSLQIDRIPTDPILTDRAAASAAMLSGATVHRGLVLSGDHFIDSAADRARLRSLFDDALAVEMEGAAVAQVCAERKVPFAVIRVISDTADEAAASDFLEFVADQAAPILATIVAGMVSR